MPSIVSSRESTPKPISGVVHGSSVHGVPAPAPRRPLLPQLSLSTSSSLHLLSEEEGKLCSELRILPKPYLFVKQCLLREFARCNGRLDKSRAIGLFTNLSEATLLCIWDEIFGTLGEVREATMEKEETIESNDSSEEDEGDLMDELQTPQEHPTWLGHVNRSEEAAEL